MSYFITIKDNSLPGFEPKIFIPDHKVEKVLRDKDEAIDLARAILAKYIPGPSPTQFYRVLNGSKFFIDIKDPSPMMSEILGDFLLHGDYEPHTRELIDKVVKPGDTCLDIGASIGYFTLYLSRLVGEAGQIYSFEPTTQRDYIRKNIECNDYQNISLLPWALWSETKTININGNAQDRDNVEAITLDSLDLPPIDFIKMDIDGSEPEALKGMIQTIERSPNLKMVVEYYPEYIKRLGLNPQDMLDILDKYFTYEKIEGDYSDAYYNLYCVRKNG